MRPVRHSLRGAYFYKYMTASHSMKTLSNGKPERSTFFRILQQYQMDLGIHWISANLSVTEIEHHMEKMPPLRLVKNPHLI